MGKVGVVWSNKVHTHTHTQTHIHIHTHTQTHTHTHTHTHQLVSSEQSKFTNRAGRSAAKLRSYVKFSRTVYEYIYVCV
jgi:hypothetical protein